jgi:hypothetical protein
MRSVGQSFDSLPPPNRARQYREFADAVFLANAAFLKAKHAKNDELRVEYLRLATGWRAMVLELEAHLRHVTQLEAKRARLCKPPRKPGRTNNSNAAAALPAAFSVRVLQG